MLHTGAHSHHFNMGIAQLSNRYLGGPGREIGVDGREFDTPIEFTWEPLELHTLTAWQDFHEGGHHYTFDHWTHLDPLTLQPIDQYFFPTWDITIPWEEGYHIYRAYFTGGPYDAELLYLPMPLMYEIGFTLPIYWTCDAGVDSSSLVSIYLDRHGGAAGYPELLAEDIPFDDSFEWTVSGPVSDSCRFKIFAVDVAGNTAEAIGPELFAISTCSWLVGDADGGGSVNVGDAVYLIHYMFADGPRPNPYYSGDADCSGIVNVSDAAWVIGYIFGGGPESPCTCADYRRPGGSELQVTLD
jgi:hypothetical protein